MYQFLLSQSYFDALLSGYDICGGFALPHDALTHITNREELIALGQGNIPGNPYSHSDSIYIMRMPASPFVHARPAVSGLDPRQIHGGVYEVDGKEFSGFVRADGQKVPLAWVEPTRATYGTTVWRIKDGTPPTHVLTYQGAPWGWYHHEEEKRYFALPTPFAGPVIRRPWGIVPATIIPAELSEDGVAHLLLVSTREPGEEGFEPVGENLYVKTIPFPTTKEEYEALGLCEMRSLARWHEAPVKILRPIAARDRILSLCTPVLADADYARAQNFQRVTQGLFHSVVPEIELTGQEIAEFSPSWHENMLETHSFFTEKGDGFENGSPQNISTHIAQLAARMLPHGWVRIVCAFQIVGPTYRANIMGEYPQQSEQSSTHVWLHYFPTAFAVWARALKRALYTPAQGAPLMIIVEFSADGRVTLTAQHEDALPTTHALQWPKDIQESDWESEHSRFPREK